MKNNSSVLFYLKQYILCPKAKVESINKVQSIIVKFKSCKSRKEFVNGKKKPGLNFFNVSVDLTRRRYLLLKTAKGIIKDNPDISYVYADINCSLGIKFKNGSFKYFNSLNELHSLL